MKLFEGFNFDDEFDFDKEFSDDLRFIKNKGSYQKRSRTYDRSRERFL